MRGPPLPTCPEMLWLSPALLTRRSSLDSMLPFLAVACWVIDMDVKRERSLAYVDGLTEWERDQTLDV